MRPGAGEGGEVGDAERVREVGDRISVDALWKCHFCRCSVSTPSLRLSFSHCLLSSDTDMEPKVIWQSSALYRGQEATQGQSNALCVCVRVVSLLLSF